ncbi:MAG: phosphoribosylformylglycinamidine cyclo-ligase [candidate division Zixibacteria bacterium]|nr:phosphoribosylformylglycinamidine cyclo-ligase [candidate division Zixibacteria bacterium]
MPDENKHGTKPEALTYASSGVDIEAGAEVVSRIKDMARTTFTKETLSDIGSFGALFDASFPGLEKPTLVSSADGVGTKLKLAFATGKHHTVGEDLVNHCINDILVQGARPLFFLDYFATGKLAPDIAAETISGIANACRKTGTAFIGGETAEMPDFYQPGEYDLAGFIVGVVDRGALIDGSAIKAGDKLLALSSNGLHTNGFSLARRALFEEAGRTYDEHVDELGSTIAEALMEIHTCYLGAVSEMQSRKAAISGMAHITGGGIAGNLSRIIPDGLQAKVDLSGSEPPVIFKFIQRCGSLAGAEMFRAFNMGVGYVIACPPESLSDIKQIASSHGHGPFEIGEVVKAAGKSNQKVTLG